MQKFAPIWIRKIDIACQQHSTFHLYFKYKEMYINFQIKKNIYIKLIESISNLGTGEKGRKLRITVGIIDYTIPYA